MLVTIKYKGQGNVPGKIEHVKLKTAVDRGTAVSTEKSSIAVEQSKRGLWCVAIRLGKHTKRLLEHETASANTYMQWLDGKIDYIEIDRELFWSSHSAGVPTFDPESLLD